MKIKFLRSAFAKIHYSTVLFLFLNLVTGSFMFFQMYRSVFHNYHFLFGICILAAPVVVFLLLRNKPIVVKALCAIFIPKKTDFTKRKYSIIVTKLTALVLIVQLLVFASTGTIMYFFSLTNAYLAVSARAIHRLNYIIFLFILLIHILSVAATRWKRAPVRA